MPGNSAAPTFGPYTLLAELGRGGQGTVWLAEDSRLKRRVALKLLQASGAIDDERLRRFRREAELASRLDHPNICGLLDAGDVDGVPFLAFRHVEGETLAARITRAWERREAAGARPPGDATDPDPRSKQGIGRIVVLFEKIARALHRAHEQGLIHRDIKPGNLMVTPDGEPVVLDFGLARDELADDASLTHSGDLLGTPAYMSPEQLLAQRVPLDRRTDVYSLGTTLYECLTLQKPFAAATRAELYQRILHSDPSSVSAQNRQIPRELQVVVETAMEKDRNRRYQTALDFAEDLRRVREFEPIRARPVGRLLRLRRWAQRHPALAVGMAATFLLLVSGLAVSAYFLTRISDQLRHTRAIALASASAGTAGRDQMLSLLLAREAVRADRTPGTLAQLHRAAAAAHEETSFRAHTKFAYTIEFSPDGSKLLTAGDHDARLWSLQGELLREFPLDQLVVSARFSSDGKNVLIAGQTGTVRVLDLQGTLQEELPPQGVLAEAFYASDGNLVTVVGADAGNPKGPPAPNDVRLWNANRSEHLAFSTPATVRDAALSRDGRHLATAAMDGDVRLWDLTAANPQVAPAAILRHHASVNAVALSADGSRILTGSSDGKIRLWSRSGEPRFIATAEADVMAVGFGADEAWLWSASRDGEVRLLDLDGVVRLVLRGHRDPVVSLHYSPAAGRLATLSNGGIACVWHLAPRAPDVVRLPAAQTAEHVFSWDVPRVHAVGPGGEMLDCLREGSVTLRNAAGDPVTRFDATGGLKCAAMSGDGSLVASCVLAISGQRSVLRVWTAAGVAVGAHEIEGGVNTVAVSADGDRILVVKARVVEIRDSKGALLEAVMSEGQATIRLAELLHGNQRLVVVHWDGQVRVCGVNGGGVIKSFQARPGRTRHADVSPDGESILTAGSDGVARLWSLDGQLQATFVGHRAGLHRAEFSRQGDRVLTASADGTARLWDLQGRTLAILECHDKAVQLAHFLDREGRAVAVSASGNVHTWILDPNELEEAASRRISRNFSAAEWQEHRDLLGEPPPEVLMQERALRRVDQLFEMLLTRERVLAHLQRDAAIPPQEREAAIRAARVRHVSVIDLNVSSWVVVRAPGAERSAYERALRQAEAGCELEPDNRNVRNTLGAAQYRLGRFADAVASLLQSAATQATAEDLAFLAMAHWQLGQPELAREHLQRLRQTTRGTPPDPVVQQLVREAEALVSGGAGK